MTIAKSVKKIKKWTKANAMPLYELIADPAPESQLVKIEKMANKDGINLPQSYMGWLRSMNGQVNDLKGKFGLIPSNDSPPYILGGTARVLNEMLGATGLSEEKRRFDCDPEIQQVYFDKQWVQFATNRRATLAIDQNPTKKGRLGQVIFIDFDSPRRRIVCKSFEEFLARLADGYESGKYIFADGLLKKRRKNAFPNFNFKDATSKKRVSSKMVKHKAIITIKGRVEVGTETDDGVDAETDPKVLKRFNGKSSFESLVTYFNSNKQAIAVQEKIVDGGEIQLEFDKKKKQLLVVTRYKTSVPLTAKELTLLKKHTLGQWSDGLGAGFADELFEEFGLNVDLYPVLIDYNPGKPEVTQERK